MSVFGKLAKSPHFPRFVPTHFRTPSYRAEFRMHPNPGLRPGLSNDGLSGLKSPAGAVRNDGLPIRPVERWRIGR
jgi:hypothetical protein